MASIQQPSRAQRQVRKSVIWASPNMQLIQSRDELHKPFHVSAYIIFLIFAASHTLAAFYAPIQDCDEVFNYWEPTHYLTDNHGFQTWEYAPEHAIRSWTYAGLHALVLYPVQLTLHLTTPAHRFYLLRIALGLICAACETRFFSTISRTLNERVAILYVLISATAPGMYHASISYLPSSFAMYTSMLAASAFMDWRSGLQTSKGIVWFGIGACLGWPFAAALSAPYLLEELILAWLSDRAGQISLIRRVLDGTIKALLILAAQVGIDSYFYRKLVVVPLNIVLYNVFSSKGPDLYGTEPWHFYLRNLALNFHIWLLFALLALPLYFVQRLLTDGLDIIKTSTLRGITMLSPLYIWLAIFTLQPHKEERFMYPVYPFIAFNAAYAFHLLLIALGDNRKGSFVARVPVVLRVLGILALLAFTIGISILRILGTWTAFSAPLSIYQPLSSTGAQSANLCLGKEWYRFPSHYMLPSNVKAKFIRSEFRGLLPGEFRGDLNSPFSGTWTTPPGMNDENVEDLGKYTEIAQCDFVVDSHMPSTSVTTFEPNLINDSAHWKKLKCLPFLDAASTSTIGRLIWTPDLPFIPQSLRRVYGDYCLLQKVNQSS